jgi:DNA-binding protein YbaB
VNEFVERFLASSERLHRSEVGPQRLREATEELQRDLTELMAQTVTATDPRGYVEATVTLGGRLSGVHISPYAIRDLAGVALGEACREAIGAARAAATQRFTESIGEFPADLVHQDPAKLIRRARN